MNSRRSSMVLVWFVSIGVVGCALLLGAYQNLPLGLPLAGLFGISLCLYLATRYPELFLAAAVFAPQWKTSWPFQALGRVVDLTVAMLACLVIGLVWRALNNRGRVEWKIRSKVLPSHVNFFLCYVVFAALVTASYFYTSAPSYGASKLGRFLLIGTLLLIAPLFTFLNDEDFRRFARFYVVFSAATALQMVFNLESRNQSADTDITRIGAGWLLGMAILLVLFYPLSRSRLWQRVLLFVGLPVLIAGLMAAASRGAVVPLSFVVLLGMATWLWKGRIRLRTTILVLLTFGAGTVAAFLVLRQADLGKFNAKAGELKLLVTEGTASGTAAKRLVFYQTTLAAIPDHFLFGRGIGSWSVFYYGSDQRNYPHNLLLEIAFEEGLLGLAAFVCLLLAAGAYALRMLRMSQYHYLALGLILLYCLTVGMFSGDLDDNRLIWLWIGITLAIDRTVRLRWDAFRAAYAYDQLHVDPLTTSSTPAYPSRLAVERPRASKRNQPWREKFV